MTPPGSNSSKLDTTTKDAMRAMLRQSNKWPERSEVIALCRKYGYYSDTTATQLMAGLIPGYDYSREAQQDEPTHGPL